VTFTAILAIIIPGVGHIYVGEVKKGIAILVAFISLFPIGLILTGVLATSVNEGLVPITTSLMFVIGFVLWLYQLIDALNLANAFNRDMQRLGAGS
jgi:TM2 domain-containing membrane protein YozV